RLACRSQDVPHMRNTRIGFGHPLHALPEFAALRNEIVVQIDDKQCSDFFVIRYCFHTLFSYAVTSSDNQIRCSRASVDTQADCADAVKVAACCLTNSCTLRGLWPVSVRTSSDIRS